MGRKRTKIRTRIWAAFSVMLLLSFSFIGLVFNAAVGRYIKNNAVSQLDETFDNISKFNEPPEFFIIRPPDGSEDYSPPNDRVDARFLPPVRNIFRISANVFIVNDEYVLLGNNNISDETLEIIQALKDTNTNLSALRNLLLKTSSGEIYYVSAFQTPDNPMMRNNHFIIYADVTGLLSFAKTMNTFFILLIFFMFILTALVTIFLSNTISSPIKKLSVFASKIGNGDFTPNDFSFNDEEFENLNIVLNNSARQLSVYDSEQKAFFQNVSHELRTPLMSIQCYAEGISFGLMEPKEASGTILQETHRLSSLVTDLLYISKIDNITTVYSTAKADLLNIISSCAERQRTVANKEGISISCDFNEPAVEYECNSELISRAVDNLISNAIRYAKSEIILSCRKDPQEITISVTDDGNGIEPQSIPFIFERFYKGSDGNHGIGLSIVKSIVEQHNGSISAKNKEGGGASFIIKLPLK